mmetsp:Transcript_38005/g.81982  ORF Transcript_38005/g.81982 Transcript_38005/m.81982 type:complete len:315 (+) Transcript_38005:45-989(+)
MQRPRVTTRPLCFLVLCLIFLRSLQSHSPTILVEGKSEMTYYQVLDLEQDASIKDIKKAYRRLAVQHHPDRNLGNEEAATIKFREISEAYEVLSDEDSRREYDRSLRRGGGGSGRGNNFEYSFGNNGGGNRHRRRQHRDPFAQFNDVFKNDPFFAEASKSMNDLFDRHFANGGSSSSPQQQRNNGDAFGEEDVSNGGWFMNKIKDYMPNIQVTTSTTSNFGGSTTHSTTSSSYGGNDGNGRRRRNNNNGRRSTYTSRSTRTVVQNGQRVTIQSLEKDGNKIEEKYIGEKLIERKINGRKEDIGRIDGGGGEEEF